VEGAGWLVHLAKSGMSGSLLELKNSPALGLVWKIEQGNWQKLTYPQFLASRRRASSKAVRACEDVSCNRPIIFRPMKNRPQAPG